MLTEWPEVKALEPEAMKKVMRCPVVVDGRNVFDPKVMHDQGFSYTSIGRPGIAV